MPTWDAHVRLASATDNDGARILRRGFSFSDGIDARTGELNAASSSPASSATRKAQFVAIQHDRQGDALNQFLRPEGSAVFAVPPGVGQGGAIGDSLFAAAT